MLDFEAFKNASIFFIHNLLLTIFTLQHRPEIIIQIRTYIDKVTNSATQTCLNCMCLLYWHIYKIQQHFIFCVLALVFYCLLQGCQFGSILDSNRSFYVVKMFSLLLKLIQTGNPGLLYFALSSFQVIVLNEQQTLSRWQIHWFDARS